MAGKVVQMAGKVGPTVLWCLLQYGPNTASLFVNFDSLHNPLSPACVMLCVLTLTSVAELQCNLSQLEHTHPKATAKASTADYTTGLICIYKCTYILYGCP